MNTTATRTCQATSCQASATHATANDSRFCAAHGDLLRRTGVPCAPIQRVAHAIRCGSCHGTHGFVREVRECYEEAAHAAWESEAMLDAEARVERFFEEGPNGGTYAGSEEEARDRWLDSMNERVPEVVTQADADAVQEARWAWERGAGSWAADR